MSKNSIETTFDWFKTLKRVGIVKLTEYNENGEALKTKNIKN
jgi:inorganic pyrophosphatase